MSEKKPNLTLVDGTAYLYRAFHAFPPLENRAGEPTGAIFGVINMLKSLMAHFKPTHMVVVFDAKGKTFRDELYDQYKAHRPTMADELRLQIEPTHQIIKAMGIKVLSIQGVEADDVIGTLALKVAEQGIQALISTGDKDMAQLVRSNISLIDTVNNSLVGKEEVITKFGVTPNKIIDLLALQGDSSDNIPGVKGIGKKTAQVLLNQIGGLKDIYANLDKVAGLSIRGAKGIAEKLYQGKEEAELSYTLATIKTDVELDLAFDDLKIQPEDKKVLIELYQRYEFKRWLSELNADDANNSIPLVANQDVVIVNNVADSEIWLKQLLKTEKFAFSLLAKQDIPLGLAFIFENKSCYFCLDHKDLGLEKIAKPLNELFSNINIIKHGYDLKTAINIFSKYGINFIEPFVDVMLQSYVLNSTEKHNLENIASRLLNENLLNFDELQGKGRNKLDLEKIDDVTLANFTIAQAKAISAIALELENQLLDDASLYQVLVDIELPLLPVLARIEQNGVLIDAKKLREQSENIYKRINLIEQETFAIAEESFNLASTKQLQHILFTKLCLPIIKKTPTGTPSTNEAVLEELANQGHQLPKLLIEHRMLSKLKSTYTDKLPQMIDATTGRLHTSYHQAVTITGRLSSSDPNLQNIPIRNATGRKTRQAFIASEGYKVLAADYSQIELRLMAHFAEDETMINAFHNDYDIHSATAAEIFGVALDKVSVEQRRSAKAINFGLIYGISEFGLSVQLGISRFEARRYMDRYFDRYASVAKFMNDIKKRANHFGFVETLFGRRLYLPELRSANVNIRKAAERVAINAPLQGSAADIIKIAMINIDRELALNDDVKMIMQVHDELVFEVRADCTDKYAKIIKEHMEKVINLKVPLIASVCIGDNWDQAH